MGKLREIVRKYIQVHHEHITSNFHFKKPQQTILKKKTLKISMRTQNQSNYNMENSI